MQAMCKGGLWDNEKCAKCKKEIKRWPLTDEEAEVSLAVDMRSPLLAAAAVGSTTRRPLRPCPCALTESAGYALVRQVRKARVMKAQTKAEESLRRQSARPNVLQVGRGLQLQSLRIIPTAAVS